jgi:hypothetical protein
MSGMANEIPPSGPWAGYYLYGQAGPKHRMRFGLVFTPDGKMRGEGSDDIGRFAIHGSFNGATSEASWTKAYIGMHSVQYAGIYSGRSICGNWTLYGGSGGFWIWPEGLGQLEEAALGVELPEPVEPILI